MTDPTTSTQQRSPYQPTTPPRKRELGTGAIIGITFGSVLAVLGLILFGGYLLITSLNAPSPAAQASSEAIDEQVAQSEFASVIDTRYLCSTFGTTREVCTLYVTITSDDTNETAAAIAFARDLKHSAATYTPTANYRGGIYEQELATDPELFLAVSAWAEQMGLTNIAIHGHTKYTEESFVRVSGDFGSVNEECNAASFFLDLGYDNVAIGSNTTGNNKPTTWGINGITTATYNDTFFAICDDLNDFVQSGVGGKYSVSLHASGRTYGNTFPEVYIQGDSGLFGGFDPDAVEAWFRQNPLSPNVGLDIYSN